KITADDGFSNRIFKTYEYSNGYAFSAFINGKVEKDFFGFGNFTQKDPYGVKTTHLYNNIPYSDFRMNRALGGAEKESHIIGADNQDYGSVLRTHDIKVVDAGGGLSSYLVLPVKTEKFQKETKTGTSESTFQFSGYNLTKQTSSDTDWFSDGAHSSTTQITITDFETISTTNQLRAKKTVSLAASANETTTTNTYDSVGNLIRKQTNYTGSGLAAVSPNITEYTYDSLGNTLSEKNVSGNPARGMEYVYDNELKIFVTEKTSFGGSIRFRTQYQIDYTSAFGSPIQTTDPNGNKTNYEYDAYGRSVVTKVDTDEGNKVLATYSYNSSFPLSAKSVLPSGGWDPDFAARSYVDGLGRGIYAVKTGSEGKTIRTGRVVYDGAGRVSRQGQSDWADSSELDNFALHLEEKNPTIFEYDAIGRVKTSTLPLAQGETEPTVLTVTYNDPYEKIEIHSSGTRKRTVQNGRKQLLYVEDSGGDGIVAQIGFCYDLAGNRIKKSDLNDGSSLNCSDVSTGINQKDISGKNQTYWAYDGFGRVRVQSDPDFGVERHEYNAYGELTKTTDAIGRVTTLIYDSRGRVITKKMPEGEIYYTYDSRSGSENALGQLVLVEDQNQTKTFSYDKLGRVKKETRAFKEIPLQNSDLPYITEYAYDLLGRVTKIDYPAHPVNHTRLRACYSYGSAGYITGISVQVNTNGILPGLCNKTIVENITYNEFGQTSAFTLGNGIETKYYYDEKLRMVRLNSSGVIDGYSETLQNAVYSFNSKNNITSIENTGTRYQTKYDFAYDGLSRLTNASGFYTEPADAYSKKYQQSFAYAQNGNLTAKRIHNPADGAITDERIYLYNNHQANYIDSSKYGSGTVTMTYDGSGNMTTQRDAVLNKIKKMEYDSDNRVIRIRDESNYTIGRYWYDDGGFRIHKSALIPDGAQYKHQEILYPSKFYGLEYMDEENVLRSINNIYLNGVRIAALNEEGTAAYYLTDQVDSVSHVLDDQGKTLTRIQNDPYGDNFVQRGNQAFSPKFNSQELDQESGFYFYNARYYDASIARFVTADSIIDGEDSTQGWNRFSYVKGNPINTKDPTGHEGSKSNYKSLESAPINVIGSRNPSPSNGDRAWAFGKGLLKGAIIGGVLGFAGGVALGALSVVASPAIAIAVGIGLLGFGIYAIGSEIHTLWKGEEDGRKIGELETYERSGNLIGGTLSGGIGAKFGIKWGASKVAKLRMGTQETSPGNSPATGEAGGGASGANSRFSQVPKSSELRSWAKEQGYEKLSHENGIEQWGIKGKNGEKGDWRLKLKEPSKYENIHPDSKQHRFSARTESGEYFDPTTGKTGTRAEYGHMPLDPD
ncbi:RHS repeat domain-containing protein, partial [Leptospira haakeii]|uniref:RHS repeat domain-containing protein n=1 Tax=Leptospira haakeii TaxID=2023198 RepID=UPI0024342903